MTGAFTSVRDVISALDKHLRTLYKPYLGAQFRIAAIPNSSSGMRFLTGRVLFSPRELPVRPPANYKNKALEILFAEHWCPDQWKALDFLSKLLSGQAEIAGHKISSSFSKSDLDHRTYPARPELWAGWDLRNTIDRDANWEEIYLPQGTLAALDLRTYLGPNEAINDWIFGLQTQNSLAADVPHKDTMITVLPDTRVRVVSAQWLPGKLRFEIEIDVPKDHLAIQVLHVDSKNPFQKVAIDTTEFEVAVPDDALLVDLPDRPTVGSMHQPSRFDVSSCYLRKGRIGFRNEYTSC
jgi:hypothetical protein